MEYSMMPCGRYQAQSPFVDFRESQMIHCITKILPTGINPVCCNKETAIFPIGCVSSPCVATVKNSDCHEVMSERVRTKKFFLSI
jgi:hypothetical protein